MRITLIALHFAEYSCRLAAALAKNHDVQLILSQPNVSAELEDEFQQFRSLPRLEVVVLPHRKSLSVLAGNTWRILRDVKRFRPDIIHSQEVTKDYLVAALYFLRRRFPFVMTVHDPIPHSGHDAQVFHQTRHGYYQKLLRGWCDAAITHGNQLRDDLISVAPHLNRRVASIPHGPLGPVASNGKAHEPNTLLFFGRINAYKGLRYFLEAVVSLNKEGLPVKGIVAGRGDDLEPNRKQINEHAYFELHDEFVSREKVTELFSRAQLIVMPYTDATQSGVAAMAIGYRRPVIATRVGSIPEMIMDGETGILVAPKDSAALAGAIRKVLTDSGLYGRLAANMEAACNGLLGWESIATATVATYGSALARRAGGAPASRQCSDGEVY